VLEHHVLQQLKAILLVYGGLLAEKPIIVDVLCSGMYVENTAPACVHSVSSKTCFYDLDYSHNVLELSLSVVGAKSTPASCTLLAIIK
jgi:hypothetical protein